MRYNVTDRQTDRQTNQLLNCLKGIACLGIVFIHTKFPGGVGTLIIKAAQFGVPLFAMIAGFYSLDIDCHGIKKRIIKLVKILCYGFFCYFLVSTISHYKDGNWVAWLSEFLSIKKVLFFVIFCTIDFAVPLWYLIAMIETYVLWFFVVKYKKEYILVRFLPFIIICRIIITGTCETLNLPWSYKINFITCNLIYFLIGYCISREVGILTYVSNHLLFMLMAIGYLISILPTIVGMTLDFSCIGALVYSVSIFVLGAKNYSLNISEFLNMIGSKLSLDIYILHVPIGRCISMVCSRTFGTNVIWSWIYPIMTVIITTIIAYVKVCVCKKECKYSELPEKFLTRN